MKIISPEPKIKIRDSKIRKDLIEEFEPAMHFASSVQCAKQSGFTHQHIQSIVTQGFQEKESLILKTVIN